MTWNKAAKLIFDLLIYVWNVWKHFYSHNQVDAGFKFLVYNFFLIFYFILRIMRVSMTDHDCTCTYEYYNFQCIQESRLKNIKISQASWMPYLLCFILKIYWEDISFSSKNNEMLVKEISVLIFKLPLFVFIYWKVSICFLNLWTGGNLI